jgi:hypothetical protein
MQPRCEHAENQPIEENEQQLPGRGHANAAFARALQILPRLPRAFLRVFCPDLVSQAQTIPISVSA